jgi:hypothetical protein
MINQVRTPTVQKKSVVITAATGRTCFFNRSFSDKSFIKGYKSAAKMKATTKGIIQLIAYLKKKYISRIMTAAYAVFIRKSRFLSVVMFCSVPLAFS